MSRFRDHCPTNATPPLLCYTDGIAVPEQRTALQHSLVGDSCVVVASKGGDMTLQCTLTQPRTKLLMWKGVLPGDGVPALKAGRNVL